MDSSYYLKKDVLPNKKIFSIEELKTRLLPVFKGYDVKKAIIFGSYGKGNASPKSDVDILVDSGLKGLKFVGLIEDIKNSLNGKEVDVFDVSHVDSGSIVEQEIKQTGVEIYAR